MKKNNLYLIVTVLFLLGFFSRFLLSEKNFYAIDSVLYTIGTFNYSIAEGTPPAPGYFLYIMTGKFLNLFLNNPHDSMVLISVIYSGLIAALLFLCGRIIFGFSAGLISALLFLTSPVFWYKGITIYGYLNSAFFILLTVLFCYRVIQGYTKYIYWAAFFYAVLAGVRPQDFPMLIFLFAFTMLQVPFKENIKAAGIFIMVSLAWFVPFTIISGGVSGLLGILESKGVYLVDNSIFGGPPISQINNHLIRMGQYFQRSYFLGIIPLFYYGGRFFRLSEFYENKKAQFFAFLLFPVLLFNIFIQFAEIGHGMCWGIGLMLLIGESVVVLSKDLADLAVKIARFLAAKAVLLKNCISLAIVSLIMAVNILMFFYDFNFDMFNYDSIIYDDRQFNYPDLNRVDVYLNRKNDYIRRNFDTKKILIVISHRFLYQLMYAFPESSVVQSDRIYRKGDSGISYCLKNKCISRKAIDYLAIPDGVSTVIIFDDIFIPYVSGGVNSRVINVGDSMKILAIEAANRKKIIFDYQSIRLE